MKACECESSVVKTACLVVGIGTVSPIGASCCIQGIVEEMVANSCIIFNISEALRAVSLGSADLEVRGRPDFAMSDRCKTPPLLHLCYFHSRSWLRRCNLAHSRRSRLSLDRMGNRGT